MLRPKTPPMVAAVKQSQAKAVRAFNRFCTQRIGVLKLKLGEIIRGQAPDDETVARTYDTEPASTRSCTARRCLRRSTGRASWWHRTSRTRSGDSSRASSPGEQLRTPPPHTFSLRSRR